MSTKDLLKGLRFYTAEQLGPKRHKTPEGFLVCQDVPIARTGEMIYGPDETPIPVGLDGRVHVLRRPEEVFKPESMASINGKPVTDDHPPVDVDPRNWRFYTRGMVINPHRGEGDQNDLLLADVIIYDPDTIEDIEAGKREVSCGYNPEYLPVTDSGGSEQPGRGEQVDIIYNHLALVERGRCGPRCSIGDRRTVDNDGEKPMSNWKDKIRGLIPASQAKALDEALAEADQVGTGGTSQLQPHIEVHNHMTRDEEPEKKKEEEKGKDAATGDEAPSWFKSYAAANDAALKGMRDSIEELKEREKENGMDRKRGKDKEEEEEEGKKKDTDDNEKILGELEFEAPPGTGDAARRATDSAFLSESFQDTASKAEILCPGIRLPTYDRGLDPRKTFRTICDLRRTTLDLAYGSAVTRGMVDAALSGRALDTKAMSCREVRTVFNAVAGMAAFQNNSRTSDRSNGYQPATGGGAPVRGNIKSIADINKANQERYKK